MGNFTRFTWALGTLWISAYYIIIPVQYKTRNSSESRWMLHEITIDILWNNYEMLNYEMLNELLWNKHLTLLEIAPHKIMYSTIKTDIYILIHLFCWWERYKINFCHQKREKKSGNFLTRRVLAQ